MKIAITGASGLIGSALVPSLHGDGHDVVRLVRRAPVAADEARWDPTTGTVDVDRLAGSDAIIHLAGVGVGDKRWSEAYKHEILASRVQGTTTIARAAAAMDPPPSVLVSAAAIGYYGDTGSRAVDESAPKGEGFLADVVERWEAAADPAREAGIRVVHPRSGLVLTKEGGAYGRMQLLFRLGLGGRLGSGQQYWSFITMADEVAALTYLLTSDLEGPVNLTAPAPATNAEVTRALGAVLHRPTVLAVPSFAIRTALGEFSSEVLGSSRVIPRRLTEAGFTFQHPDIDAAAATLV
jgi:uncharacterized protein (TIGR01777 family)